MLHEVVKNYYGDTLGGTCDLKTDACSTLEIPTAQIRNALSDIHEEVSGHYYGCGLAIPECLDGLKVLDKAERFILPMSIRTDAFPSI